MTDAIPSYQLMKTCILSFLSALRIPDPFVTSAWLLSMQSLEGNVFESVSIIHTSETDLFM